MYLYINLIKKSSLGNCVICADWYGIGRNRQMQADYYNININQTLIKLNRE
jgi:hypothetical protein